MRLPGLRVGGEAGDLFREPSRGDVGHGDPLEHRAQVRAHGDPDVAKRLGRAAVLNLLGPLAADVRDRPLDCSNYLREHDLLGGLGQPVTALGAALALHKAGVLQLKQDVLEELERDLLRVGDPFALDRAVARGGPRQEGDYRIALNGRTTAGLGCTVGCGWALLIYPEVFPPWLRVLLGAAWVGGLFAPAGFWMRTRGDATFAAAALATGLAGAPVFTPLVATPALQWLAAALGILAGAAVRIFLPDIIE